jgi:CIC family chloride channel protein
LLKTFVTATTLNFGGSGGLFFPTIVVGAGLGYIFSMVFDVNFAVMFIAVGMAALLSGTHKILLTPVAFVMETLGGIFAIPALLASCVSYIVSDKYSFFPLQPRTRLKAEELALERFFIKGQKQIPQKLKSVCVEEFMTKQPIRLHKGVTVKNALDCFEQTKLRVLPIIDENNYVVGVANLEDLGFVDVQNQDLSITETVLQDPEVVHEKTTLEEASLLMLDTQQDHLFVLDTKEKLVGVVSGIDVVKKIISLLSESQSE